MRHVKDQPFLYALSPIGGKWKLHILFHLWKNPVLHDLCEWGHEHMDDATAAARPS